MPVRNGPTPMLIGRSRPARVALSLVAVAALVVGLLVAVLAGTTTRARAAGFGNGIDLAWGPGETVSDAAVDAARLEALPDGRLAAVMATNGTDTVVPGGDVLLTRIRDASGVWSAPETVSLGSTSVALGSIDTYADAAGRLLVVWADQEGTDDGAWSIRWAARSTGGVWSPAAELYETRTANFSSLTLEIGHVRPRLVSTGATVTLAWTDVVGYDAARVDVSTAPFHARRWVDGAWESVLTTDGYGTDGITVSPISPTSTQILANPVTTSRASDGRISVAYTLRKSRPLGSMDVALSDGFSGPNAANVWDGVAEPSWSATSQTTWVMHLDPADGSWGAPQQLVKTDHSGTACAPPDLPANPPLEAYWSQWKAFSLNPGIAYSCPAHDSEVTGASYASDGTLRIGLKYKASPTATVVLNQYLDFGCDGDGSNSYRFCFDSWDSTEWAVEWNAARIGIPLGSDGVGFDAVQEGAWPEAPTTLTASTDSGPVTVTDQSGTGNSLVIDRGGSSIPWTPDPASAKIYVTHVFAHGDDVAIFHRSPTGDSAPGCSVGVLGAGAATVTPLSTGCASGTKPTERDVVQLTDGSLALIDAAGIGARVRLLGAAGVVPADDPSGPQGPVAPNPLPPATFVNSIAAKVVGTAKVGKKLKADPGAWSPTPAAVTYQWLSNGKVVKKATKKKLRLTAALRRKRISVRITLTAPGVATRVLTVKAKGRVR